MKMAGTVVIHLAKSIKSVKTLTEYDEKAGSCPEGKTSSLATAEQIKLIEDLKVQKRMYREACLALESLVSKLNRHYDEIFAGHKEEIARLSVEIARKVLMQKIQDRDYEIESIIKETLKNSPTRDGLIVHLNPEDLTSFQKVQKDNDTTLDGIKFLADSNIGCAECILESPTGIIKSLIDEHLEQISKALEKVE
jgi:flagellar biosynthesis/type III secretory pathway protein FliH